MVDCAADGRSYPQLKIIGGIIGHYYSQSYSSNAWVRTPAGLQTEHQIGEES